MNSTEVADIQKTWATIKANPTESGMAILLHFFEKYPSNLEKFPFLAGVPAAELKENARLKKHANRIIAVFDDSVSTLGADGGCQKLEQIWTTLAKNHVKRQIKKESYNELKECVVDVLVPACKMNDAQKAAWSKVLDAIYAILFKALADNGQTF